MSVSWKLTVGIAQYTNPRTMLAEVDFSSALKRIDSLRQRWRNNCLAIEVQLRNLESALGDAALQLSLIDIEQLYTCISAKSVDAGESFIILWTEIADAVNRAGTLVRELTSCREFPPLRDVESEMTSISDKLNSKVPRFVELTLYLRCHYPATVHSCQEEFPGTESLAEWEESSDKLEPIRQRVLTVLRDCGAPGSLFNVFRRKVDSDPYCRGSDTGLDLLDPTCLSLPETVSIGVHTTRLLADDGDRTVRVNIYEKRYSAKCVRVAMQMNSIKCCPNVVALEGVTVAHVNGEDHLAVVTEDAGVDLQTYMQGAVHMSDEEKLLLIEGVLCGLVQLHKNRMAHGNLTLRSIYCDPRYMRVCIGDLSDQLLALEDTPSRPEQNSLQYCAPEFIDSPVQCIDLDRLMQADVYSLGVITWELWNQAVVYDPCDHEQTTKSQRHQNKQVLHHAKVFVSPCKNEGDISSAFRKARRNGYLNPQCEKEQMSYTEPLVGISITSIDFKIRSILKGALQKNPASRWTALDLYYCVMKKRERYEYHERVAEHARELRCKCNVM